MSLNQLITACQQKNAKAQSQLYKLYASKLFSVCLKYSKNYAEAEDNLHDAFLVVFNKIEQYHYKGSFEGWLKRITINTALKRYRTDAGVYDIRDESQIEATEIEIDDTQISLDILLKMVQDLPDRYRLVFNLYVLDGYSHKEISDMIDISVGTSKSNLSRARLILKNKIESYYSDVNSKTV